MSDGSTRFRIPPHVLWPGMVFALLGMSVTLVTITVIAATGDPSFAVEADYYERAESWDERKALERRSAELGWSVEVSVGEPDALRKRPLIVTLTGADGRAIEGARVTAEHFHHATADHAETLTLAEAEEPGVYSAPSRVDRPGFWEVRLRVNAGGDVFVRDLTLDLYAL